MATIQTKLKFTIRKKKYTKTKSCPKLTAGKENVLRAKHSSHSTGNSSTEWELSPIKTSKDTSLTGSTPLPKIANSGDSTTDSENEISDSSSPPKRGRISSNGSSDSHLSSPSTPSQLISRVRLVSPTELKRFKTAGQCFPPKRLFSTGASYQHARQALHSSVPTDLPGRQEQLAQLHEFLSSCLDHMVSGTLYVSGPPGTGKTACLVKIMELPEGTDKDTSNTQPYESFTALEPGLSPWTLFKNAYKMVYVNCTSMRSSSCVYARITQELRIKTSGKNEKDLLAALEKYLATSKKMILVVLDEIDQLDSRKQSVLYTIFEWPSKPNSRLVLIGIANALDLTDRILPRLQARLDMKPRLLNFPPYSKQQIVDILAHRLKESGASEVFSPVALQLLAGKVASVSGDVRRALDIARRVTELTENKNLPLQLTTDYGERKFYTLPNLDIMNSIILSVVGGNTPTPKESPRKTQPVAPTVELKEVMSVLNNVYATSQKLGDDDCDSFPLQQKVLLCTLILMLKKGRNRDITVGKLHEVYRRVCIKRNLLDVDQSEFFSLCHLVETRGILRVQRHKEPRLSKVCLQWDEEEVGAVLKDKQLLAAILNDTASLAL
uniref:Cell division control protein n=1 Tax=Timema californicum TaxID=61474 RepID=A0A7R9J8Q5_TIMCA|nr:unnamed protein product [Timema californicum]